MARLGSGPPQPVIKAKDMTKSKKNNRLFILYLAKDSQNITTIHGGGFRMNSFIFSVLT